MILETDTKNKYGYTSDNIGHFSQKILICKCDICNCIFEKEAIKIFITRKSSKSEIDLCTNIECIKKKRENTIIKRFGVSHACQSEEVLEKRENTNIKNYGVKHPMMNKSFRENTENTNIKKYGVKNVFSTNWCKEKIKETCLEKYGTEYFSQSEFSKNKIREVCLKKYGVPHFMSIKNISQKSSKTWLKKIYDKMLNENTEVKPLFSLEEFEGFNNKNKKCYPFECKKCGNKFENNYMGVVCYKCNPLPRSKPENELYDFLKSICSNDDEIKQSSRKPFNNEFEIDFYIPSKNLAIEFDGNYYHSELFGKDKNYHLNKTEKCEKLGIHLIHIFEDEWNKKQEIIKSKLKHILNIKSNGDNNKKIYARNCEIRLVSNEDTNTFLDKYHIQGKSITNTKIGLYYENELVSIMTFSFRRLAMGNKIVNNSEYELNRYASKYVVVGGAGKLLSYFIKTYKPSKIVSYADRRWTYYNNNLYEKIGFKKISDGSPNYWYMNKKDYSRRYHRFNFRKDQLPKKLSNFDPILTEWENMQINDYDRIWDCGSLKYEMIITN